MMNTAIKLTKPKILIVEDMGIVAEDLRLRLRKMGYDVVGTAASSEVALEKVMREMPNLVLMDIRLEGSRDGIETAELIRSEFNIPAIFLTGNTDQDTLRRAKASEAYGFITKPFNENELKVMIEIALHKSAVERERTHYRNWLTTVLGSIGDAVITTDLEHRVTFLNPTAESLTGWANADASGRDIADVLQLIDEETRESLVSPTRLAIERNEVYSYEKSFKLLQRNGAEIFVEDSAAPLINSDGEVTGAVITFRDVSEKKELELRLSQSQKLEAIGRLAGGIAHDFNNLLTIMLGNSELILRHLPKEDRNFNRIDQVKQTAIRAARLTSQLMAFSRKQILRPQVLNLNLIITEMQSMLTSLIGEDIIFSMQLADDLNSTKADPSQIEQILLNLVANARDAMPTGGRLVIKTANVMLDENYVDRHPQTAPGSYVMLSVSDTGEGIPAEVQANIFEPFFTTKELGRGTGLGLATVYGIVKQSGGNIWLYSEHGVGTTLKIYLPTVFTEKAGDAAQEANSSRHFQSARQAKTVLVVEDKDNIREIVREMIELGGYQVLTAGSGSEAIKICDENPETIDLLLTDIIMPEMNGYEVGKKVRRLRPDMKVIYMSGYGSDVISRGDLLEKEDLFIEKPFTSNILLAKIDEALNR